MPHKSRFNGYSNEADWIASEHNITVMPMTPLAWLRRERLWRKFDTHMSQDAISTQNRVALTVVSSWERGRTMFNREHALLMAKLLRTDSATIERAMKLTREVGRSYFAIIDAIRDNEEWESLVPVYQDNLAKANAWIVAQCKKEGIDLPEFLAEDEAVPA